MRLFAFFPLLIVLVEAGVAIGGNYLLIHEVGGSIIPAYIRTPLFILSTVTSFVAAFLITKKSCEMASTRSIKLSPRIFLVVIIVLLAIYGLLRLDSRGVLIFVWDTIVNCCTPTGNVSGLYLLLGSGSAMIGMKCYYWKSKRT